MTDNTYKAALAHFDQLVAEFPDVERKGKTMPYTSLNGHMFSFLDKQGALNLRLGSTERDSLIENQQADLTVQHGRTMKDFVSVPDSLLRDLTALKPHFQASLDHTGSLKPKPTKKK